MFSRWQMFLPASKQNNFEIPLVLTRNVQSQENRGK